MMQDDKKMAWIIAAAIIAAAIIVAVALNEGTLRSAGGPEHATTSTGAGVGAGAGEAGGTASGNLSGAATRSTYKDRTIQFDDRCQATPNAPTYKNGTSILLDNRFEAARAISIGGRQFTVPGYGYVIVNLFSQTLPQKYNVDCDFSQNVSTILLQK